MHFTQVERSRAFESIVSQIEEAIYSGRLKPGDNLPSERSLVDQFHVSRSSIREALRILENMGLIRTRAGSKSGPTVSLRTTEGISRLLHGTIRANQVSLSDIVQYRMMSGAMANRLACIKRTSDDVTRLRETVEHMRRCEDSGFADLDARFHEQIRDIAGNELMSILNASVHGVIVEQVDRAVNHSTEPGRKRREFIELHEKIVDAIESRDVDLASQLATTSLTTCTPHY